MNKALKEAESDPDNKEYKEYKEFLSAKDEKGKPLLETIWEKEGEERKHQFFYEPGDNTESIRQHVQGASKKFAAVLQRGNNYEETVDEYTRFKKACDDNKIELVNTEVCIFFEIGNSKRYILTGMGIDFRLAGDDNKTVYTWLENGKVAVKRKEEASDMNAFLDKNTI